jgi:hypothetical protein
MAIGYSQYSSTLNIKIHLPTDVYFIKNLLFFDGGFESPDDVPYQMLKIGEVQEYEQIVTSLSDISWEPLFSRFSTMEINPFESENNEIGSVHLTDNYLRYVSPFNSNNNLITYIAPKGSLLCLRVYFYVSKQADSQDLLKYDQIVESITIVS